MSGRNFIKAMEEEFTKCKGMTDKSILQITDEQLHDRIDPQQNSIAVIMQHVAGNLQSRFTDLLTSDGEKPGRDREAEFTDRQLRRSELIELWERGWGVLFTALSELNDDDLAKTVYIRKEPHSILKALVRSSAHCAWHAAQVASIAKHLKGQEWRYLTIPPGGSTAFNQKMRI